MTTSYRVTGRVWIDSETRRQYLVTDDGRVFEGLAELSGWSYVSRKEARRAVACFVCHAPTPFRDPWGAPRHLHCTDPPIPSPEAVGLEPQELHS
jgi:hypothetical protein